MTPSQRDQVFAARTAKRLDHVQMVTARPIQRLRKRIGVKPDAVDLAREQLDRLDQAGIAAQPEQKLVKAEVTVKHRQQVTGNNGGGVDDLSGMNVNTIALQLPFSSVTATGAMPSAATDPNAVIGGAADPDYVMSPHIWQWRWHLTMAVSILHRLTGVALYGAALILAGWALALAAGPDAYDRFG